MKGSQHLFGLLLCFERQPSGWRKILPVRGLQPINLPTLACDRGGSRDVGLRKRAWLQKWMLVALNSMLPRLLRQMLANCFGVEFSSKGLYKSSGKEKESWIVVFCSRPGEIRHINVVGGKEMYKKCDALAKLLFCLSKGLFTWARLPWRRFALGSYEKSDPGFRDEKRPKILGTSSGAKFEKQR